MHELGLEAKKNRPMVSIGGWFTLIADLMVSLGGWFFSKNEPPSDTMSKSESEISVKKWKNRLIL